ncbi:MAG: hypothetical protein QQN63_08115 [Nitrosopumilus sp.]
MSENYDDVIIDWMMNNAGQLGLLDDPNDIYPPGYFQSPEPHATCRPNKVEGMKIMSELTICNYCKFESMQRHYKEKYRTRRARSRTKYKLRVRPARQIKGMPFMGGVDVLLQIHPKVAPEFLCWFMELPKHCCC